MYIGAQSTLGDTGSLKEIPADKTCTSLPQTWSVPRGDQIEPEPVMKCTFAQAFTDQVGKRKRPPISCKLYDARSKKNLKTWMGTRKSPGSMQ